jgi:hypothetical protein
MFVYHSTNGASTSVILITLWIDRCLCKHICSRYYDTTQCGVMNKDKGCRRTVKECIGIEECRDV